MLASIGLYLTIAFINHKLQLASTAKGLEFMYFFLCLAIARLYSFGTAVSRLLYPTLLVYAVERMMCL